MKKKCVNFFKYLKYYLFLILVRIMILVVLGLLNLFVNFFFNGEELFFFLMFIVGCNNLIVGKGVVVD